MSAKILALLEHHQVMEQVSATLKEFGHTVFQANNFPDAMHLLGQQDVDLIIGDVHLQNGGSVFDFLRWVKGDPHLRLIPFVCFSTEPVEVAKYLSDGVRTAARALGAARYVTMERFDRAVLLAEVEWLLPQERAGNVYADATAHEAELR